MELYTLPKSTAITAIELEEGNGVTWVYVEYRYNGETVRGYTGLKRIDASGNIPWANHIGSRQTIVLSGSVFAAPAYDAAYRGWVDAGDIITLLDYEMGFAFIEFHDYENGAVSRGDVDAAMLQSKPSGGDILIPNIPSRGVSATPNQKLAFRTGPNTAYPDLFTLPQNTEITAYEYEEGNGVTWVLVEFEYEGRPCRAYTGLKRMDVHGSIPWANHEWIYAETKFDCKILSAPFDNAVFRSYIYAGTPVSILTFESGYAYIEYYDYSLGMNSRGYVPIGAVPGIR